MHRNNYLTYKQERCLIDKREGDCHSDRGLEFEEKRLCVLIDGKIRRKEFSVARDLAEELFEVDAKAALLKRAARVRKFSRLLLKSILFLAAAFTSLILFMVMNLRPLLDLKMGMLVLSFILFAISINIFLGKLYRRKIRSLAYAYERAEAAFVSRVLDSGKKCEDALRESEDALPS